MLIRRVLRTLAISLLALAAAVPGARASDKILHLAIGDPARKDREAPVVLDAVTDTKTGEVITPAELAPRLSSTRLLLLGEEHTSTEFHQVQFRVLDALLKAGRHVLIGLEMYPYPEQRFLDQWRDGLLSEESFLDLSRWYENWGYNWLYYRDIFLLARDHQVSMFAVNTPREIVAAVRKKGLANLATLTPEEAAHIPRDIDVDNADHMTFFKTTFEDEQGPVHNAEMPEEMWKNMLSAQATWDATMGFNAVQALKQIDDPKAIMVVLVGSGHVAYGLGIERQARKWFDGTITDGDPRVGWHAVAGRRGEHARVLREFHVGRARRARLRLPDARHVDGGRSGGNRPPHHHRAEGVARRSGGTQDGRRTGLVRRRAPHREGLVQPPDGRQAVGRHCHACRPPRH